MRGATSTLRFEISELIRLEVFSVERRTGTSYCEANSLISSKTERLRVTISAGGLAANSVWIWLRRSLSGSVDRYPISALPNI